MWNDTLNQLSEWSSEYESALVAFSGGKDSLCVMDLACKTFKKVAGFYMYFVPGLQMIEDQIKAAEDRWGVQIVQIPHFSFIATLREGQFCDLTAEHEKLPDLNLKDVYAWMLAASGADLLLTGAKDADGIQRRQFFENVERQAEAGDVIWQSIGYPIKGWRKRDVVEYLNANKIPLPPSPKGVTTSGVQLKHNYACWLAENYPDDWAKILRWFPYAHAMIKRREFFGV